MWNFNGIFDISTHKENTIKWIGSVSEELQEIK